METGIDLYIMPIMKKAVPGGRLFSCNPSKT